MFTFLYRGILVHIILYLLTPKPQTHSDCNREEKSLQQKTKPWAPKPSNLKPLYAGYQQAYYYSDFCIQ